MWPDWAIYSTLDNFSNPATTIILPKLPTILCNFSKGVKSFICLMKSFLGNFYWHLATFYRSHWLSAIGGGVIICVVCGAEVLAPANCYYCPFSLSKWKLKLETLIANESSFETVDQKWKKINFNSFRWFSKMFAVTDFVLGNVIRLIINCLLLVVESVINVCPLKSQLLYLCKATLLLMYHLVRQWSTYVKISPLRVFPLR